MCQLLLKDEIHQWSFLTESINQQIGRIEEMSLSAKEWRKRFADRITNHERENRIHVSWCR
jgi:hypothetical protein